MKNNKKTYGAKGDINLDHTFYKAIGVGVNQAIRELMKEVQNLQGTEAYDVNILVNHIQQKKLTNEIEDITSEIESTVNKLNSLKKYKQELINELNKKKDEEKDIEKDKKEFRNNRINKVFNKILYEYYKNKESFNSVLVQSIIDDADIDLNINIIVDWLLNLLKSVPTEYAIRIHPYSNDEGVKVKLTPEDIKKIHNIFIELKIP